MSFEKVGVLFKDFLSEAYTCLSVAGKEDIW